MLKLFKRLWTGETDGMTAAALIVGASSLASRVLGLVRDRMLAGSFGAGDTLDAYYAAFRMPDLLYNLLIVGALSAGFIPVFSEYFERRGKEEAFELANQVVSVVAVILLVGSGLLMLLAPVFVPWIAPGFSADKTSLTVMLTRIMLLSPVFLGISGVQGGVLQSLRRFTAFAVAPVLYNVGIIGGILFLAPRYGVVGVSFGVIIGAFLHMVLQATVVRGLGKTYLVWPSFRPSGVRKIVKLMLPRTAGLAVSQVNLVLLTALASGIESGAVAVFTFANNIQSFPFGLLGLPFAIAAFPLLARAAAANDTASFVRATAEAMRKMLFFLVPATVAFILLRAQVVRLVLGQGAFNWNDTIRTADTLAWFAPSLVMQACVALFARAFYARQDTWTPVVVGVVSEALGIACAFWLRVPFGVAGLAIAFSIATTVQAAWLGIRLFRTVKPFPAPDLWPAVWKTSLASLAFVAVGYPARQWIGTVYPLRETWQVLLQGGLTALVGCAAFFAVSFLLRSRELSELLSSVKARVWRRAKVSESAVEATGIGR